MSSPRSCQYIRSRQLAPSTTAKSALEGPPIGGNDLWIAAHARTEALILVTNNEREFRRVPRLSVENWMG
ncbi:hypothetical protein BH24PSE2_BH24PSE2_07260 [soil metagenome]